VTPINLTRAEARRLGIRSESENHAKTRKQARATTQSSEAGNAAYNGVQDETGGNRYPSHPALSGPVLEAVVGGHLHRWRWCGAWACWVSRCGIGRHNRPDGGQAVDVGECLRCFSEEVG
jgi:hypothetical protein